MPSKLTMAGFSGQKGLEGSFKYKVTSNKCVTFCNTKHLKRRLGQL